MSIVTPAGRLSYPRLFTPEAFDANSDLEYTLNILFPPGTDLSELKQAAVAALVAKSNDPKANLQNSKSPFSESKELEGWTSLKLKRKAKIGPPEIVRRTGGEMHKVEEAEGTVYPGVWIKCSTQPYAYTTGGRGVAFGLNSVLLVKHDDPFVTRERPEQEFASEDSDFAPVAPNAVDDFGPESF